MQSLSLNFVCGFFLFWLLSGSVCLVMGVLLLTTEKHLEDKADYYVQAKDVIPHDIVVSYDGYCIKKNASAPSGISTLLFFFC